jgi:demethylmenaquinone methyltransferase/2-methoxy-6-polyprenyl-1,4-benzoquinol methylase
MDDDLDALLGEQIAYYRARAPEYDEEYVGRASWDRFIDELPITGDILELACGTGRWTPLLARRARSVTAVDAAPEMLALAGQRVRDLPVELVAADVFGWQPPRRYDTVFFAFWLSHVPPARFAAFWSTVRAALAPGGRACFLDTSNRVRAVETVLPGQPAPTVRRRLRDGSEYRAVKVFYGPADLAARLAAVGWSASIREVGVALLVGAAHPRSG